MSQIVPEISQRTPECPFPQRWKMYDGMSTEVETVEFLQYLVQLLKPEVAIETGTYVGWGTLHIALGMHQNQFGVVHTAEPYREHWEAAAKRLAGYEDHVKFHHTTGLQMIQDFQDTIDFAFLDSNIDTRLEEMRALIPRLKDSGVVAIHDTSTYHQKNSGGPRVPFQAYATVNNMQIINLDTPRGLTLMRRWPR
jgi:predicted O-methyltransferase YrrM